MRATSHLYLLFVAILCCVQNVSSQKISTKQGSTKQGKGGGRNLDACRSLARRLQLLEETATVHNISHGLKWFANSGAYALTEVDEEAIRHDFAHGIKLNSRRLEICGGSVSLSTGEGIASSSGAMSIGRARWTATDGMLTASQSGNSGSVSIQTGSSATRSSGRVLLSSMTTTTTTAPYVTDKVQEEEETHSTTTTTTTTMPYVEDKDRQNEEEVEEKHECRKVSEEEKRRRLHRLDILEEMATTHNISHALTWFSDGGTHALTEADEEAIRHDFANGIKLKLRRLTHACQQVIQAVDFKSCVQGEKLYNSGCVACGEGFYQDSTSHTSTSCKKCTEPCGFGESHSCSKTSGAAIVSLFFS